MNKVISMEEAVNKIGDGTTLAIMGSGGAVNEPVRLLKAIGQHFVQRNTPKNLTIYHACGLGDKDTSGTDFLACEGLVRREIAGFWGMAPKMAQLALEEKLEAYNIPQGVAAQMYRAVAGNKPGVITKTGLHTFIDPRLEGGKMNQSAKEDLVRVITLNGEEWLWYPAMKFDVGLVRGTMADCSGNITSEEEAACLDGLSLAQAVHNSGGIVIAQVKYCSEQKANPKKVSIPGIYVDYIVVDSEQKQTCQTVYEPALSGTIITPTDAMAAMGMSARKIIARRAAKELPGEDSVINLGVGMPDGITAVAAEEGYLDRLHLTIESGIVGGMPMPGVIFGTSSNPDAIIDMAAQFDFYDGGGLDVCFLGMAQFDADGNVNSSKTGKMLTGCGGAINISQNARKVVFCGTFTAKGLETAVEDGKLIIRKEGEIHKLVSNVDQITFSGAYACSVNQPVLYVTERAVFEMRNGTVILLEIAPGIDLQKEILDQMEFMPAISETLKVMDSDIFA